MKIVYHLVGEQRLPIFLSAIQFPDDVQHILICSDKTRNHASLVQAELSRRNIQVSTQSVGGADVATDFTRLREIILHIVQTTNPQREECCFDITGGTKPMAIVALALRNVFGCERKFCYLDTQKRKMIWIDNEFSTETLTKTLSLENFVRLCDKEIRPNRTETDVSQLRDIAYANAGDIQRFQEQFAFLADRGDKNKYFEVYEEFVAHLSQKAPEKASIWCNAFDSAFRSVSWTTQARYLGGGWLEDYIASVVKSNYPDCEIQKNVAISRQDGVAQEFDVAVTDGFALTIIECKAGKVTQDHVQKLENICSTFSGAQGKGILLSLNPSGAKNNVAAMKRIRESRTLAAFCGRRGIEILKKHLFDFKTGTIYE
ncbi:MAG: DUF1887 family CARF protein [Victivallaceae bacterium]|nr:DUF1887 family CARF protein [Victivallaceae bacterium]